MAKSSLKERLAKKRKELSERGGGLPYHAIKEGTTRMRALPVPEDMEFAFEATTFYLGQKIGTVISPTTFGGKCAIMEAYNQLSASKKEADRNTAKNFKPGKKFFSPHIKYKDEKGREVDSEAGVKLLIISSGLYQKLIDLYLDEENGDFTDIKLGYDLKYKRTGKGKQDTEYDVLPCRPSPLAKQFTKEKYNPEEMLKAIAPNYKRTKELIEEYLSLPPADEEEEQAPPKKKKKRDL